MNSPIQIELSNKTIAITGGYGHLGSAISKSLLAHGARVFVLGRSKSRFEEAFAFELSNIAKINFVEGDIAQEKSWNTALELIYASGYGLDVLINNASFKRSASPENTSLQDWNYSIDGVLGSVFKGIQAVSPYFKDQGNGKIINVSSIYAHVAPPFELYEFRPESISPPHYGASKAGLEQLTRYYAAYLGRAGITVNTVSPGPFPKNQVQENQSFIFELAQKTVLKRIGKPEELAGIFTFLSSDASNYITGQNFVVDGGWTIQ